MLADGKEGGWTVHLPDGAIMTIYDASALYQQEGIPLIVIAGRELRSGSSRDWAAKGPLLQGVRAVIAQSYERIHRSNLVGMGILPLQFRDGESAETLHLDGTELYTIRVLLRRRRARPCTSARAAPDRRTSSSTPSAVWTARPTWSTCATAVSCRSCCVSS